MKKRKDIAIGLIAVLLLAACLYSGFSNNYAQGNANKEVTTTFIKDGDEILTPSQWIDKSLREIYKIKPGMRRTDLNKLFISDGGISTRTQCRYVYREASIKIDVEFEPAGNVERDEQGRLLGNESDEDVIKKVSKPYLERGAND